MTTIHTNEK